MEVNRIEEFKNFELPLQLNISFKKIYLMLKEYTSENYKNHPFHTSAKTVRKEVEKFPELINGFSDLSLLKKHEDLINILLEALFPEILTLNEIKAATVPFTFTSFKFTKRFENILKNAADDFELKVRNFEDDQKYIMACTFILANVYNYPIDLKRPFFFDIPDKKLNLIKHYRVAFNGDFMDIIPTEKAPKITEKDIKNLLDNFENIDIWKEKFPKDSYIFNGFGIMNLFDVTADENISAIQNDLLRGDQNLNEDLQRHLSQFYNINDLKVGYSTFDCNTHNLEASISKKSNSLILAKNQDISCVNNNYFCEVIIQKVFNNAQPLAISDVEKYGVDSNFNLFYKKLKSENIGSIILLPITVSNNNNLAVLEIASPRPYELNSINLNKLKDLKPVFEAAAKRASEEHINTLEATIQEHYTSIHPSVKWRFYEAAEQYQKDLLEKKENIKIDNIVFNDVYPLYGQSDIKGSSIARNNAIKQDLTTQLTLAISVLKEACKSEKLPIYNELMFRVNEYLKDVVNGLKAGDEIGILDFLKRDIYPVFNHIKEINAHLNSLVKTYMTRLDDNLQVVYEKRKDYERSVTLLNDRLAKFIDKKQEEAQNMFPHYFERYKTDGVEYNMYIGQSLTKKKKFDTLFLHNLRLWQLQVMYEMENIAQLSRKEMKHDLQIASLILVHSNSLAINFRMDEKQFDVDGAYNIRYEIIKKRIDKAHIKNTNERLTVPGKIAIVYSQEKDATEYLKYIKYLQSKKQLGAIEKVELEDLQGVSGLKAMRVEVLYQNNTSSEKTITIDELMREFKA